MRQYLTGAGLALKTHWRRTGAGLAHAMRQYLTGAGLALKTHWRRTGACDAPIPYWRRTGTENSLALKTNQYIMKHIILLLVAILSINNAHAQWWSSNKSVKGNEKVITKTYGTSDYDRISGRNNIDITIVKGKEGTITVEAESNIMEHLEIEVKGNRLEIGIKEGCNITTRKGIKVYVPVEKVSSLSMAGSGDIASNMTLKSREMHISVAGSGDIDVAVASERLHVRIAGSGDVKVSGRTEHLDAAVAGSGGIAGFDLKANHVDASIAGSGDISVFCMGGELQASIVGSGDLRYKGTTSKLKKSILGSGDITKM
jgi:hypothetical protein